MTKPDHDECLCTCCWGSGVDARDQAAAMALKPVVVGFLREHLSTVKGFGADFGESDRGLLMRLYERDGLGFSRAVDAIEHGRGQEVSGALPVWAREHRVR